MTTVATDERLPFWKCYAEGNAYVVVEAGGEFEAINGWINHAAHGLGGDGVIVVDGAPGAEDTMRIFNADGSEAEMCGNGARSAAAVVALRDGLSVGAEIVIDSPGGTVHHELIDDDPLTFRAEMTFEQDPVVEISSDLRLVQLELGAPHLVVFGAQPHGAEVDALAAALSQARPGGTNVMFASHDDDTSLTVTPWERGVGPVLGCATGAAAAAIASERLHARRPGGNRVRQPGGTIAVEWDEGSGVLAMTGTVQVIASGTIALEHAEIFTEPDQRTVRQAWHAS